MAVISGTETLDAPLDHPRDEGEDRTNLIINYLPQVMIITLSSSGDFTNISVFSR